MKPNTSRVRVMAALALLCAAPTLNAQLHIAEGVVVKFGPGAGLVVGGKLTTGDGVLLTSIKDDNAGGQTLPVAGSPQPGDWAGVRVTAQAREPFARASIRYAEVGLDLVHNYVPAFMQLAFNQVAIRISGQMAPVFNEYSLSQNITGVRCENGNAQFLNSEFVGSSTRAVDNLSFAATTINARNNWWGHPSGPQDPFDNPAGQGDTVSRGVNYGAWLSTPPLIDCSVTPLQVVTSDPATTLKLKCRGATEARLSESLTFAGVAYSALMPQRVFVLSEGEGVKTIYAQFRGAQGQTRQTLARVRLQVSGPVVEMTAPLDSLVITADTTLSVAATVTDSVAIASVQFFVGNSLLGVDTVAPYEATWNTLGFANGPHNLRAVATNIDGVAGDSIAPIQVQIARPTGDVTPPDISELRFAGELLLDGQTLTGPGLLSARIVDSGDGLSSFAVLLNDVQLPAGSLSADVYQTSLLFTDVPNGPLVLRLDARDTAGNQSSVQRFVTLAQQAPLPPVFTTPAAGSTVTRPELQLRGDSAVGSRVQLYLDAQPILAPAIIGTDGRFSFSLTLLAEGTYAFTADASNAAGTGALSQPLDLTWIIPPPSLQIASPNANALISRDVRLGASVVYARPGTELEFRINGQLIGSDNSAPFFVDYSIANELDGDKQLTVTARNGATTLQATRNFRVQRAPPPPVEFQPPYLGSGLSATPLVSYGLTPVVIGGRLRQAQSTASVPGAAASLVLRSNGFDRRINVVSDADGNFSFSFVPRSADQGVYQVTAMHPDAVPFTGTTPTGIAEFTINRLTAAQARTYVPAPRGFAQEVRVTITASAGAGAKGVRILPTGSVPMGISLTGVIPADIPSGHSHTFIAQFNSTQASPGSGSLLLAVLADDSGSVQRAGTRFDFELFPAAPALLATPTSIYTGVRRGEVRSEVFVLKNRGLVAATEVSLQLQAGLGGGPVPSWINLVSPATLATLAPGETRSIELSFAPGSDVPDGVYDARLQVAAANAPGGPINVTAAVNAQGEGQVRFKAVDIFTETPNEQGQLIPGLANTRIVLTSETNPNLRAEGHTNAQGEVTLSPLPPGRYLWRASAALHEPASGRTLIRPGIIIDERVFLDFASVSFTWTVTPTTIADNYNVNINATYQTQVPAPMVVVEPAAINLPDMQIGEVISGEFTVTNRGLLRADDVSLQLGGSDAYYRVEVQGTLPNELAAGQTVVLPYKVTALQTLPGASRGAGAALDAWLQNKPAPRSLINKEAKTGEQCGHYVYVLRVPYTYSCAAGDQRNGSGGASIHKVYGGSCGSTPPIYHGGGPGAGNGGGWAGGSGSAGGGPPQGPTCGPDCTEGCGCTGGCNAGDQGDDNGPDLGGSGNPPKQCQ